MRKKRKEENLNRSTLLREELREQMKGNKRDPFLRFFFEGVEKRNT